MDALRKTLGRLRHAVPIVALLLAGSLATNAWAESFAAFLAALHIDAAARGITQRTFDAAFAGVEPDPGIMTAMRREPEYGKPMGAYLAGLVSPDRIAAGRRKAAQWADTLRAVGKRYGVDPDIIVSIWGIESSFGEVQDRRDVFRSLAKLARARFQHPLFRDQLLSALEILQQGKVPRQQMTGSWAGAMGQAQFLPSSYQKYAVAFGGNGHPDIWTNVPDVLASIGNYLQKAGWQPGLPWGFEVTVPRGFDYRASRGSFRQWAEQGFRRADGAALPASGDAILFFPSGGAGPAFLVTANFIVIKQFNNSDAYALAAGELADRLRGLGPIRAAWPVNDFQPSRGERIALQRRLSQLGFKVGDFNGHIDFDLRDDVREMQRRFAMIADGYPGRAFLNRLGVTAQ